MRTIEEILENFRRIEWVMVNAKDDTDEKLANRLAEAKHAIQELFKEPSITEIWGVLRKVHGCKTSGEDCLFSHCHNWSECEILSTAIHKLISTRDSGDQMVRKIKEGE